MIIPGSHFSEIEMGVYSRNVLVEAESILSAAPEALNTVDALCSLRAAFFFPDDNVLAPDDQRHAGPQIVGVMEAS